MASYSAHKRKKRMATAVAEDKRIETFVEEVTRIFLKATAKLTPEERQQRLNSLADYVSSLGSGSRPS
jgi:hypothetical protein